MGGKPPSKEATKQGYNRFTKEETENQAMPRKTAHKNKDTVALQKVWPCPKKPKQGGDRLCVTLTADRDMIIPLI